jgi:hypothetical protein
MTGTQFAVPIKRNNRSKLDPIEEQYNNFIGSVRSTIEQVFGYLKTWAIISSVYRGMLLHDNGYSFLSTAFLLCCELYNARFTILGHNKREMKVVLRDSDGVPVCPPPNLTPAYLTLRDNIHAQLSRYKTVSNKPFYRSEDIDSKNEITTFKTTDPIWMFHEPSQDFIKGNITGCLNGFFCCSLF